MLNDLGPPVRLGSVKAALSGCGKCGNRFWAISHGRRYSLTEWGLTVIYAPGYTLKGGPR